MTDARIPVSTEDLAVTIAIWLPVIGQRRPAPIRDLWTHRGEQIDGEKQRHARHELARYLAENLTRADHQVTRAEQRHDALWRYVSQGEGDA